MFPTKIPASEQVILSVGERLCDLKFLDLQNNPATLYNDRAFGWPKAILVTWLPDKAVSELVRMSEVMQAFGRVETHVLAVTSATATENAVFAERFALPYPLFSNPDGSLQKAAGQDESSAPCILLFDPLLRLEKKIARGNGENPVDLALSYAQARYAAQRPVVVTSQAPALVLPNLLNAEHCSGLIKLWQKSGNKLENIVVSEGIARTDTDTKIRSDVSIPLDSPVSMELISVMRRRLLPEIRKAFNFEATRFEFFRIGRYDAADGGHFAPHRDNTSATLRHRRYALIVNLNTGEYEGGFLRLPEYGTQLYAPHKGGAVVFSCSVLHTATPMIKGQRFVLIGFFWGEEEQRVFAPKESGSLFETMSPKQSA